MIHNKYCPNCGVTTTWFKDMCMKCQKKEPAPKQATTQDVSDLFKDFFGGMKK